MVLSDPYLTAEQYFDRMKPTVYDVADDHTVLEARILAVCRLIDRETGNVLGFQQDASAQNRTYKPGHGGLFLDIGDDYYASVATITVDGTALVAADWELRPLNAALLPEPAPFRRIFHLTGAWSAGSSVVVNGVGGWPSVPNGIVELTSELVALLTLESPRATSTMNEVSEVIKTSPAGQGIILRLKREFLNPSVLI